ncbi:hypothetical protein PROFUN_08241 [Planoprotostelium fungivorum]|uniref:Uncharacterized protein n=1 Tax=Planoprotostelium fungivorum TaxID=1890364 RepID=A0A2P6NKA1_9EUKA|nr:hypothetical protein PROFUN_08241 [Planoprotostelium fungivorum]
MKTKSRLTSESDSVHKPGTTAVVPARRCNWDGGIPIAAGGADDSVFPVGSQMVH